MSADERTSTNRGGAHESVEYADPQQHGALSKLKHLLERVPSGGLGQGQGGAMGSDFDLDLQLDDLTLPQLPDVLDGSVVSSSGRKRPVARARRGRGRKGGR